MPTWKERSHCTTVAPQKNTRRILLINIKCIVRCAQLMYLWMTLQSFQGLRSSPVNGQTLTKSGAGMPHASVDELLGEYSPALRSIYQNHSHPRTVRALLEFGTFSLDYMLPNGKCTTWISTMQRSNHAAQQPCSTTTIQ